MARATPAGPIAVVLHDLRGGGAERMVLHLAEGMVAAHREVDLVLVNAEGPYLTRVPKGVRLVDLGKRNVFKAIPALSRYLRDRRPAAVLAHLTHVNTATLIARMMAGARMPVAITEHNWISRNAALRKGLRNRLVYAAVPLLYRLADTIVGVSNGVARDVERYARLRPGAVRSIPNPYNRALLAEREQPPQHDWLPPEEVPVLVTAGRLHPQKGYDILLRAMAIVVARRPAKLIIMGEGAERSKLASLIEELGIGDHVSMPGFVENPYAAMRSASAYVMSSRWEGLPMVIVEALACGAPVIATDCGANEILEDGRYGLVVPVEDPAALAEGILSLLDGAHAAQPIDLARYEIPAITRQYLDVLDA